MLADVKTDYHTFGCRPSPLLCGLITKQSSKTQWIRRQNCFNWSRGSRDIEDNLSSFYVMHYRLGFSGKVLF